VSPDGSGDSWFRSPVTVGWTCAGGGGWAWGALSEDGDGLDSAAWVTDSTVLTQTAGLGLRARAVAATIKSATAPATASATFLPTNGR